MVSRLPSVHGFFGKEEKCAMRASWCLLRSVERRLSIACPPTAEGTSYRAMTPVRQRLDVILTLRPQMRQMFSS
jgi:hypothetical protein